MYSFGIYLFSYVSLFRNKRYNIILISCLRLFLKKVRVEQMILPVGWQRGRVPVGKKTTLYAYCRIKHAASVLYTIEIYALKKKQETSPFCRSVFQK